MKIVFIRHMNLFRIKHFKLKVKMRTKYYIKTLCAVWVNIQKERFANGKQSQK